LIFLIERGLTARWDGPSVSALSRVDHGGHNIYSGDGCWTWYQWHVLSCRVSFQKICMKITTCL
jgi:hypothetical protein